MEKIGFHAQIYVNKHLTGSESSKIQMMVIEGLREILGKENVSGMAIVSYPKEGEKHV